MATHFIEPSRPDAPPPAPDEPDVNLTWWVLALVVMCALVVLGIVMWAGDLDRVYGSEGPPVPRGAYPIDRQVTVSGKVQQVLGPTEFTLSDTDRGVQQLRVITETARTVPVGSHVRVTGHMDSVTRLGGKNDQPVLHATQIEMAGEGPREK